MIGKTNGATFTLYFASGDTYSADFRSKKEAEEKGYELARENNLQFVNAEKIKPVDFYFVG